MANIRSAKKKARQAARARIQNTAQKSAYRTLIRNVIKAIDAKDKGKAEAAYKEMAPVLDRYAAKGMIHKNKAARHKSRLTERIRALG